MLDMDVIVSVDGMPAHLAGALGRPVFLLLKHQPDWRWMAHPHSSPWYPATKLFRQSKPGDWNTPIRAIASELKALARLKSRPAHPGFFAATT